jgi:hypothetical protein
MVKKTEGILGVKELQKKSKVKTVKNEYIRGCLEGQSIQI